MMAGLLALTTLGGELETSLGAVVSTLGNMGPALGEAGPTSNYAVAFTQPARLVLALLMVIGRLEIFPILLTGAGLVAGVYPRLGAAGPPLPSVGRRTVWRPSPSPDPTTNPTMETHRSST